MKKIFKKIFKPIAKFFRIFFRILYRIIDLLIVTPLSKIVYKIGDMLGNRNSNFDKFLGNPTTLLYISLFSLLVTEYEKGWRCFGN